MTRTGFAAVVVLVTAVTAASTREPTFSRVETYPDMGRLDYILAVADFNDDARDDILAGGREEAVWDGSPEDRHDTTALEVFFGQEDGTFEHAADVIDGTIEAWQPVVVAADFNNDEQIDFAVFDAGVYVGEESVGYGNPPQLWLSDNDGVLRSSESLADAVRVEHALRPPTGKGLSAPADLHKEGVIGTVEISSHPPQSHGLRDGDVGVHPGRLPRVALGGAERAPVDVVVDSPGRLHCISAVLVPTEVSASCRSVRAVLGRIVNLVFARGLCIVIDAVVRHRSSPISGRLVYADRGS